MSLFNQILFNGGMFGGSPSVGLNSADLITYSNFGILGDSIYLSEINDKIPPQKIYDTQPNIRGDGLNFIDSHQERKIIPFRGRMKADTRAELLTLIDTVMRYIHTDNGVLRIDEGGRVRQYIANLQNITPEQKTYHVTHTPFSGEFVVFSPFGFSEKRKIYTKTVTASSQTFTIDHEGSGKGRIQLILNINSAVDLTSIKIENTTKSQSITILDSYSAGDILEIDGENNKVKINSVEVEFSGVIPDTNPGINEFVYTITSTSHNITDTKKLYNYYN